MKHWNSTPKKSYFTFRLVDDDTIFREPFKANFKDDSHMVSMHIYQCPYSNRIIHIQISTKMQNSTPEILQSCRELSQSWEGNCNKEWVLRNVQETLYNPQRSKVTVGWTATWHLTYGLITQLMKVPAYLSWCRNIRKSPREPIFTGITVLSEQTASCWLDRHKALLIQTEDARYTDDTGCGDLDSGWFNMWRLLRLNLFLISIARQTICFKWRQIQISIKHEKCRTFRWRAVKGRANMLKFSAHNQ